jgi:putative ABC transport system permease protein
MNLVLRTGARTADVVRAARAEVLALDREQALGRVQTMDEIVSASVGSRRFQTLLCAAFGGLALLLAALGLYGLIAWSVAQRTREIGIRMALGAERRTVLGMILLDGLRLAGAGLAIGLVGALVVSRTLQSQLYGVTSSDPLTYGGVAALIAAVAALASLLPALRAASIAPSIALRSE